MPSQAEPVSLPLASERARELTVHAALTVFMIVMTNFLLLIGAGLFSKSVWAFQTNAFNHLYVAPPHSHSHPHSH